MSEQPVDALDERAHATAVAELLTAALAGSPFGVYEYDALPAEPPNAYLEYSLARMNVEALRWDGSADDIGWRLSTRVVGKTIAEARWLAWKTARALNERQFTIPGVGTTTVTFEGTDDIAPDDGWWSALTTWTYTSDT